MITINLLTPERKQTLKNRRLAGMITRSMVLMLVMVGIFLLLLVGIRLLLFFEVSAVETELQAELAELGGEGGADLEKEANEANTTLTLLTQLQRQHVSWSPLIRDVVNVLPEDVTISSFSADVETGRVKILGSTNNRESVLALEKELEKLEKVKSVEAPFSNITQKDNISFTFTIILEADALGLARE